MPDVRKKTLEDWLSTLSPEVGSRLEPASSDASFRRYFRVPLGDTSLIAMDAPPEHEDTRPFIDVAARLAAAGLHVPCIRARDSVRGFLLMDDLGRVGYMDRLDSADADVLMDAAVEALVRMQSDVSTASLPRYDAQRLGNELDLFPEWFVRCHLGWEPDDAWWHAWSEAHRILVEHACAQPQAFVHRDYMPRNLMVTDRCPGILDFQDAVLGPITYDLASLLRDAFISWPPPAEDRWIALYLDRARRVGLPIPEDDTTFRTDLDLMASQRHLKVLGIFARLHHRDRKPAYIADTPRFLAYLERETADHPVLAPLRTVLQTLPHETNA